MGYCYYYCNYYNCYYKSFAASSYFKFRIAASLLKRYPLTVRGKNSLYNFAALKISVS